MRRQASTSQLQSATSMDLVFPDLVKMTDLADFGSAASRLCTENPKAFFEYFFSKQTDTQTYIPSAALDKLTEEPIKIKTVLSLIFQSGLRSLVKHTLFSDILQQLLAPIYLEALISALATSNNNAWKILFFEAIAKWSEDFLKKYSTTPGFINFIGNLPFIEIRDLLDSSNEVMKRFLLTKLRFSRSALWLFQKCFTEKTPTEPHLLLTLPTTPEDAAAMPGAHHSAGFFHKIKYTESTDTSSLETTDFFDALTPPEKRVVISACLASSFTAEQKIKLTGLAAKTFSDEDLLKLYIEQGESMRRAAAEIGCLPTFTALAKQLEKQLTRRTSGDLAWLTRLMERKDPDEAQDIVICKR